MLTALAIENYRSIRDLVVPLTRLNAVTGANGSGKCNLYRALRLLSDAAQGSISSAIAREGGLDSTLWAGPENFGASVVKGNYPVQGTVRSKPVRLKLGFAGEDYSFGIELGLPIPSLSAFSRDPQIKTERLWVGEVPRKTAMIAEREGPVARARGDDRAWVEIARDLAPFDSMMTHAVDPAVAPEIVTVREAMRAWRFYDHFRTDSQSEARSRQIGTYTPALSNSGADLAAAIQTIFESGDREAFDETISDAFPGASVEIRVSDGYFEVAMAQHGLLRPLRAEELSDGTLRYLLLAAALLSPRSPGLLVLNEPETSLHADLLPALARLIGKAAGRSQIIVVSHAQALVAALQAETDAQILRLEKRLGETLLEGQKLLDKPPWRWP
jgi:predicted ATPase